MPFEQFVAVADPIFEEMRQQTKRDYFGTDDLRTLDDDALEAGLSRLVSNYARPPTEHRSTHLFLIIQEVLPLPSSFAAAARAAYLHDRCCEPLRSDDFIAWGENLEQAMINGDTITVRIMLYEEDA